MKTLKIIFKTSLILTGIFAMITFYSSCRKKISIPPNPNDEELITTLQINFTDSAGIQPNAVAIFRDADGAGGLNPTQWDTIILKGNTTYLAQIFLFDETKTPADTISNEVLEEGKDHLFCFTPFNINTTIQRTDFDINNLEIGLQSKWATHAAANGALQVVLRHQPDVKNGACEPGASDLDVTFQCIIQ